MLVFVALLVGPPGAPLRHPETGAIIGNSPFMNSLIVTIALLFFAVGTAYGIGAGTMKTTNDIVNAMIKAIQGLGGLIFLLLVISQFIAYFNYTNMSTIAALSLADALQAMNLNALWLLVGFVIVVFVLDLIITGAIPKWALFAPVFVPLLMRLNVDAGGGAGRLPGGRLADQLHHAAERVLRLDRDVRPEVPEGRGRGDGGGADAAVRPDPHGALDDLPGDLAPAGPAMGAVSRRRGDPADLRRWRTHHEKPEIDG